MFSPSDQMLPYATPRTFDRWKPKVEVAPNCPRCDSSNTKFCYYNNYSLAQPRYFCKGCRRYWTKGGSLRHVPFGGGGGCRKSRRSKPIRLSNDPATSHIKQLPNSLRPDLVLDDMVGNSRGPIDTMSDGGSTIDLGLIYDKFLNDAPFDLIGSSNSNQQMPVQLSNQGPPEGISESLSSNEDVVCEGGLNFWADPSCSYDSLAFPAADVFLPNCSFVPNVLTWHAPDHDQGFHQFPENNVIHHQDLTIGDWSTLDQSTFDAF